LLIAWFCVHSLWAGDQVYRFGVVPQFDARQIQSIWQPILSAIEKQSGMRFELVLSSSISKFEQQLLAGDFDFAYMNPYQVLEASKFQNYTPLVRDVARKLYGIVVTRKDSKIQSVKDLEGKVIAFPAPNALGASLLLRAEFSEKFKINIKPKYVRNHGSVYLNVVTGLSDAGGGVQKTLKQQPERVQQALKIIYKTEEIASHPIAAHGRVVPEIQEIIRNAILQLGDTPIGQSLLGKIPMVKVGKASEADYEPLKQMGLEKYTVK
jgi:phosphonate transport system substrate-binding protein